jgi:Uncharacterised nucleotidyltransferase
VTAVRWDRVDALVDVAPGLQDLRAHGLQLLAARRRRMSAAPVPAGLVREELEAAWRTHAAPRVLAQVRAACDGPLMVVKGPAVASRYPHPATRPFIDLDLLVPDAQAAQAALLGAGFRLSADPAGYPDHLHHLPPLHSPADPIPIEVHSRLKWVDGLRPPTFEALAEEAESRALGVEGVLTPAAGHHALLLAGHLWAHDPLARVLRILDVAVMAAEADAAHVDSLAREWGMCRLWQSTTAVAEALFADRDDPWPLRTWARGLRTAREPSVTELHLSRLLSPFAIYPPGAALRAVAAAIEGFARPHDGEPWRRKLGRTAQQIARPGMRRSEHVQAIEAGRHPHWIDERDARR